METLISKKQLNIAHITRNHSSTNHLINMFHESSSNDITINENFDFKTLCDRFIVNPIYKEKMDLFIFEFLEDKKTVIFIGETHLLYLLFSKQIFKEATVIPIGFGFGFAKIRDRVEHAQAILVYDFKL